MSSACVEPTQSQTGLIRSCCWADSINITGNENLAKLTKDTPFAKNIPNGGSRPPTLKHIAQLSGLAVPTVSRALSGASDIGLKTRERIRKIADEIGYVPNRAGLGLRTGKTNLITLLMPNDLEGMNYSSGYVASIASALRETQYNLILTPFFPDQDPMCAIGKLCATAPQMPSL